MTAPQRFAKWLDQHRHYDRKNPGMVYHYHPRSDDHSKALAEFIWEDLLNYCEAIRIDYQRGLITHKINYKHTWKGTHKEKTIDLAVVRQVASNLIEVLISCELKSCMTEHGKSQPRIYDELSSSHAIVHAADPKAIAAGVTVVNIADTFISPLRQIPGQPTVISRHNQPHVTESMVRHLRGLRQRADLNRLDQDGFDAYCTFVVDCDNDPEHPVTLWTAPPAPQPNDVDHYDRFLKRICQAYTARFFKP